MKPPKEIWVNVYDDLDVGLYAHVTQREATDEGRPDATAHRYILAPEPKPKREPIAWVVKRDDGAYLASDGLWGLLVHAERFRTPDRAAACVLSKYLIEGAESARVKPIYRKRSP